MAPYEVIVWFAFLGLLGGVAYVLLWRIKDAYEAARYLVLGGIVGFVYSFLYSDYSFPNFVMAFVTGFASEAFLDRISEWRQKFPT